MQPLTEQVNGVLYESGVLYEGKGEVSLLLQETAPPLYLRYALLVQGSESLIFPALLLDDWGRERRSLALYQWIYMEGQRFPRADLFGFDAAGREQQRFLRELEIFFKYPCYAYLHAEEPMVEGRHVSTILVPDPDHSGVAEEIAVPDDIGWPLRHAAVTWRRVDPQAMKGVDTLS